MRTKEHFKLAKDEFDSDDKDRRDILDEVRVIVWLSLPLWAFAYKFWPEEVTNPISFSLAFSDVLLIGTLITSLIFLIIGFIGSEYELLPDMKDFFAKQEQYFDELKAHPLYSSDDKTSEAWDKSDTVLYKMLVKSCIKASAHNKKVTQNRYKHLMASRFFLIVSAVLTGVTGVFSILN